MISLQLSGRISTVPRAGAITSPSARGMPSRRRKVVSQAIRFSYSIRPSGGPYWSAAGVVPSAEPPKSTEKLVSARPPLRFTRPLYKWNGASAELEVEADDPRLMFVPLRMTSSYVLRTHVTSVPACTPMCAGSKPPVDVTVTFAVKPVKYRREMEAAPPSSPASAISYTEGWTYSAGRATASPT